VIDIYTLGGTIDLKQWLTGLESHKVTAWPQSRVDRAAWTGNPFIVAGDKASLQKWFDGLDSGSINVIQDHAYFWVLTSDAGFRHKLLPEDRLAVLNWTYHEHNVIHEALDMLSCFPKLSGLSKEMHHLREEIIRIGTGPQEPATPVLIFGESGSGKEGTAQSLFAACSRSAKNKLYCLSGAWLDSDSGMSLSELFGIDKGVATLVEERAGLVELHSDGAIFIDDFDTAPRLLQERLLRITSTPKGSLAPYRRVGGEEDRYTNVWLIFATNHDITEMLKSEALRLDFLFRFEDRVIVIPPLRNRPADLPAIAHAVWRSLVAAAGPALADRTLPWRSLRDVHSREQVQWKGNVRELAALLSLVVSMCKMPKHRHEATSTLIDRVLAKGPSYFEWFGILTSEVFTAAPPAPDRVNQILASDVDPTRGELSTCEIEIRDRLGEIRWNEFLALVLDKVKSRGRDKIRRILCRYQLYALRFGATLSKDEAMRLSGLKETQALTQLKWLSESNRFLQPAGRGSSSNSKWIYGPGSYYS
jgi:DNA-binding NtrC family response regulator